MPSSPIDVLLPHRPAQAPRPATVTNGEHRGLLVALAAVPDPRDPRGTRYPLVSMLAVAAVGRMYRGRRAPLAVVPGTNWVRCTPMRRSPRRSGCGAGRAGHRAG